MNQYKVKLYVVTFLFEGVDQNSARAMTFATKGDAMDFVNAEMDYYEDEYGKGEYETKQVYDNYAVLNYSDVFFTWDITEDEVTVDESAVKRVE